MDTLIIGSRTLNSLKAIVHRFCDKTFTLKRQAVGANGIRQGAYNVVGTVKGMLWVPGLHDHPFLTNLTDSGPKSSTVADRRLMLEVMMLDADEETIATVLKKGDHLLNTADSITYGVDDFGQDESYPVAIIVNAEVVKGLGT